MLLNRRGLLVLAAFVAALLFGMSNVRAKDNGQWKYASPDIADYFAKLMQPDSPVSCCGSADLYWADKTDDCRPHEQNCALVAIITDTRDDAPLMRAHIPAGTRIIIPPNKVRRPPSNNPTQHTIVFVGPTGIVYCFEPLPLM